MYREKEWGGGGGSQADRRTNENYESINSKNINVKNKQAMGCQALAQQTYFPLCAQLDLWDDEQYSPLSSQTLTQAGEFSFSVLAYFQKKGTGQPHGGSWTTTRKYSIECWSPRRPHNLVCQQPYFVVKIIQGDLFDFHRTNTLFVQTNWLFGWYWHYKVHPSTPGIISILYYSKCHD